MRCQAEKGCGILLTLTLVAAFYAGFFLIRARGWARPRFADLWPVFAVFGLTAVFGIAQLIWPSVLTELERNGHELRQGQVWRLATPLVVQDGGTAGTIFNLATILFLGIPFAMLFGARRWLVLYLGTGLIAEVLAYSIYDQGRAGNSIANFGIAAGLTLAGLRSPDRMSRIAGLAAAVCGAVLLVTGNLHGGAFAVGIALSWLGTRRSTPQHLDALEQT